MKVGIKYCGGCNPRFDRAALVEKLEKEYGKVELTYDLADPQVEHIVAVCGCERACVKEEDLDVKSTVAASEGDYPQIVATLDKLM